MCVHNYWCWLIYLYTCCCNEILVSYIHDILISYLWIIFISHTHSIKLAGSGTVISWRGRYWSMVSLQQPIMNHVRWPAVWTSCVRSTHWNTRQHIEIFWLILILIVIIINTIQNKCVVILWLFTRWINVILPTEHF